MPIAADFAAEPVVPVRDDLAERLALMRSLYEAEPVSSTNGTNASTVVNLGRQSAPKNPAWCRSRPPGSSPPR